MLSGSSVVEFGWLRTAMVPLCPDLGIAVGDVVVPRSGVDQVHGRHDLGEGRGHLSREVPGRTLQHIGGGPVRQHPLAQLPDGGVLHRPVARLIQPVPVEPRDFILLVGDGRILREVPHRHLGQHDLRRHALRVALRSDFLQPIARLGLIGLRQHVGDSLESIRRTVKAGAQLHCSPPCRSLKTRVFTTTGTARPAPTGVPISM